MAGPVNVNSKTVTSAGTAEALTATSTPCTSVYVVKNENNTGAQIYICDSGTPTQKIRVPATGITVPVQDAADVLVDVDTDGDAVDWLAV